MSKKGATQPGDDYVRALAKHIRQHERALADLLAPRQAAQPNWLTLGLTSTSRPAPVLLRLDPHHLFYVYLRFGEAGIGSELTGPVDIDMTSVPARPMSYISLRGLEGKDESDTKSFISSIGSSWWGASAAALPLPADVRYLYSCFTKLPALHLSPSSPAPSHQYIQDFETLPDGKLVPLYAFKNLQLLVLRDLDPRAFIGWDALSLSLRRLELSGSGLEDVAELFIDAVVDDARRRAGEKVEAGHRHDASALPPSRWSQLRHLSLASNDLTFLPSDPFSTHFTSLVHLDLSGNLLVAIPSALASLSSLRSLNVSNNMVDTVQGVYKHLGAVTHLDLSANRLDALAGLDRLFALERLDLSSNRLVDASELERLATLPHLADVLVKGNPCEKQGDGGWKVGVWSAFARNGRSAEGVRIDGAGPSYGERRRIEEVRRPNRREARPSEEVRPQLVVKSPPRVTSPDKSNGHARSEEPVASTSRLPSPPLSPTTTIARPLVKKKKRKPRRIVDLDGDDGQGKSSTAVSSEDDAPLRGAGRRQASAMSVLSTEATVTEDEEDAAAFRRRIEALRNEVGPNWLSVLNAQQQRPP